MPQNEIFTTGLSKAKLEQEYKRLATKNLQLTQENKELKQQLEEREKELGDLHEEVERMSDFCDQYM